MSDKKYNVEVLDTGDGTGDCIIEFPPEILAELGWDEGTELNIELKVDPAGNVIVISSVA